MEQLVTAQVGVLVRGTEELLAVVHQETRVMDIPIHSGHLQKAIITGTPIHSGQVQETRVMDIPIHSGHLQKAIITGTPIHSGHPPRQIVLDPARTLIDHVAVADHK